jgi:hypothetical protein
MPGLGKRDLYPFKTQFDRSALDNKPCVFINYDSDENPAYIRAIRDEVREVAPGLFFGPVLIRVHGDARHPAVGPVARGERALLEERERAGRDVAQFVPAHAHLPAPLPPLLALHRGDAVARHQRLPRSHLPVRYIRRSPSQSSTPNNIANNSGAIVLTPI